MAKTTYDVIIIGGGPAGLTAGLYASRAGLKSLLLEKGIFGGQITFAEHVENFPGFPEGINGMELGERMREQAGKYGLEIMQTEATEVNLLGRDRMVKTLDGDFTGGALILAGGSNRRKLGVPGEAEFTGRGVSYCATCDAAFFRDMTVVVVGGGDAALTEALHLTKITGKVTLIHRRHELRATRVLQERALKDPKMAFIWDTVIDAIKGNEMVQQLQLTDVKTGKSSQFKTDGIFVAVGFLPDTEFVKHIVELDATGHIVTNEKMETSVAGIFAAGDIRFNSGKQAIAAAGDGATAAIYAQKYLTES